MTTPAPEFDDDWAIKRLIEKYGGLESPPSIEWVQSGFCAYEETARELQDGAILHVSAPQPFPSLLSIKDSSEQYVKYWTFRCQEAEVVIRVPTRIHYDERSNIIRIYYLNVTRKFPIWHKVSSPKKES